jgi:cell filamentation protein
MDPYVYPGTNVLRNLLNLRDADELSRAEAIATALRIYELQDTPKIGKFDAAHLQSIHRHIFQDLFDWAGEFRTVNISRSGQMPFAFWQQIAPCVSKLASDLARERYLEHLNMADFCKRAAFHMGELNAIHPFREGNGRTQREFIGQLAVHNGYTPDWTRIERNEMYAASHLSFQRGNSSGLEAVLRKALDEA